MGEEQVRMGIRERDAVNPSKAFEGHDN
jgi:hypothetical protein